MNVSCPQCNHAYKLDESRIPETGQRMRCPKCSCTFRVHKGGTITDFNTTPTGSSAAPPPRPSVIPKRPERRLRPTALSEPPHGDRKDDADLPTPALAADLPAPRASRTSLDELDLPTPALAADLPAPRASRTSLDEIDLPTPAAILGGLPAGDIPAPNPNDPFGDIDLFPKARPVAPSQPPAPAPAFEDPFGDLNLPTPATGASLPAPKLGASGGPRLSAPGFPEPTPQPTYEDPFGDIDLKTSSPPPPAEIPPARPEPRSPAKPAAPFTPPVAPLGPPPAAAKADLPRQRVQSSGSTDYGEINLEPGESDKHGLGEFDEFPTTEAAEPGRGHGGTGDLDVAVSPHERLGRGKIVDEAPAGEAAREGRKGAKFEGRRRFERQSRRFKALMLVVLVLAIAGGGSLSLTEFGPFGVNIIARILPNATENKTVARAGEMASKRLREDTFASIDEALREIEAVRREYPENEDLNLLGAFLYNLKEFRFGHEEANVRRSTALLGKTNLDESESPYASLVKASRELAATQAQKAAGFLVARPAPSPEELALLAEAQLVEGNAGKALATSKKLLAREKSARASYLVARARALAGDRSAATMAFEKLIAANPRHAGGRLSLASLLLTGDRSEAPRIEQLLLPVTQDTRASRGEKARAFALVGRAQLRSRNEKAAAASFDKANAIDSGNIDLSLGEGFLALCYDDLQGATTYFVKARSDDSSNVDAKLGHAEVMFRQNLIGDTKALVAEVLAAEPGNPFAHYLKGRIALALKNLAEAEKELGAAIAGDKGLIEAYVALSDVYVRTGRDKEAAEILDKANEEAPGSALVKLTLADAYAERGDFATAIVALNDALAAEPDDIRVHFRMAQLYRKLGSANDASQALGEVLSRNPDYPGVALEQGLLLEGQGKIEEALAAYERALKAAPGDPAAKLRVGATSITLRDYIKAEPLLAEAVAALPGSTEANFFMGELFRLTDRAGEGIPYFRKAIDLDDGNAFYHLRMGMAFMAMHDMTRAADEIERARAIDPKLAEAPLRAGEIKLRTGGAKDAIGLFEEALSKDPTLTEAYGMTGEAWEELGQPGQALRSYERAVAAFPDDAGLNFKLGITAMQVTGKKSAFGPLSRAVALADRPGEKLPPWLPEAYYRLGGLQQAAGQTAAAIATFKRYLEIAPERAMDRAEVVSRLEQLGVTP